MVLCGRSAQKRNFRQREGKTGRMFLKKLYIINNLQIFLLFSGGALGATLLILVTVLLQHKCGINYSIAISDTSILCSLIFL